MSNRFDVIGDVHGQFDKLVDLLVHLGYRDSAGVWRHSEGKTRHAVRVRWWLPEAKTFREAAIVPPVAKGGPLVAYRWDGEAELANDKLVWV